MQMALKGSDGKCNTPVHSLHTCVPNYALIGPKVGPYITGKLRARISRRKGAVTTEETIDGSAKPETQHIQ